MTFPYPRDTGGGGVRPGRVLRRATALVFAGIQAILVVRILLDLGVVPADWGVSSFVITASDALAAPVQSLAGGIGGMFGSGVVGIPGDGFNPAMVAALVGWTAVEALVMRVVTKVATA